MVLFRKLLLCKLVQDCHFLGKYLSRVETFRHQHVLTNHLEVRHNHRDISEESLKVVRELGSSSVTWVHCNEDTDRGDESHFIIFEENLGFIKDKTVLNGLDLGRYNGQDLDVDSVELIEAAPETCLDQTTEDDSHSLVVLVTTAGDDTPQSESLR
mgnify:CR=1 FL=1